MKKNMKLFTIIFALLLIVAAIASFSWFYNLDNVAIDSSNNMNVQVGSNLEITVHGSEEWGSSLKLNKDLAVVDCSGNGTVFYTPSRLDENNQPDGDLHRITDKQMPGYVIDTYVDLRTNNPIDLYLGSKSFIKPVQNASPEESTENSFFGPYLTGYIAGSARVAFFEVSYEGDTAIIPDAPVCIWAPNSYFEYNKDNNTFTENGTREEQYIYYSSESTTYTYTTEDYLGGKLLLAEGSELCTGDASASSAVNHAPKLLSFRPQNGMEVKHLLIRIWFEGTDREASSVFNNGKVNYNFSFVGTVPKEAEHTAENTAKLNSLEFSKISANSYALQHNEGGTVSDYTAGMFIWSTNGIDWNTVGANKEFTAAQVQQGVYIALAETNDSPAGGTLNKDMILLKAQDANG